MPRPDLTPLPWDDEALDALSEVSAQDVEEAKAAWRRDAKSEARELLDAKEEEPEL
jgi:hypothetical protein